MKNLMLILLLVVPLGEVATAQDKISEVNFQGIEPWLNKDTDTTYVINFWATWCKPCVEELPYFLKAASELKGEKVKFVFVSLDFPSQKESRLIPFVEKNQMDELVILLNDPDSNSWINKVNTQWSGAIPATLIYRKEDVGFFEKSLSYSELKQIIKSKQL